MTASTVPLHGVEAGVGGGGGGGQNTKLNVRLAIRQGADLFGVNISANKLALLDYSGSEL